MEKKNRFYEYEMSWQYIYACVPRKDESLTTGYLHKPTGNN